MRIPPLFVAILAIPALATAQSSSSAAVLTTRHFAFYSDLTTNVEDALIATASARLQKQPEPFATGSEKTCLDGLPASVREPWDRAVEYYATRKPTNSQRVMQRLVLAGLVRRDVVTDAAMGQYLDELAAIREAATPAYRQCRWPTQDALNRQWIERVKPLLDTHEAALGEQLPRLFQKPWAGLPFRVDVVQTAGFSGGNSASAIPPTLHIYISSTNAGNQDRAALEIVFHEAVHFLTTNDSPLAMALASAVKESGLTPPKMDLLHGVHFFITGEAVRRAFAVIGGAPYVPYLSAQQLFSDQFREAVARIWPAYMDGTRTMPQAAADLVRALSPP